MDFKVRQTPGTDQNKEAKTARDYYQKGIAASQKGELEVAIASFQQAIALKSDFAAAYCNLGGLLAKKGQVAEAIDSLHTAIKLQPNLTEAYCNLGIIQSSSGQISAEAVESFQKAIALNPALVEAHYNLGNIWLEQGERESAIASYQKALKSNPKYHLAKFALAIAQLPVIYTDEVEIGVQRERYRQELETLAQYYQNADEQERSEAASAVGSNQPFYLTYQGQCDRQLQSTYGEMIRQLMAARYPQWSKPLDAPKVESRKVRVGFVSGFFNHHSVWKILLQGWVENLDKSEFELFGYFTGNHRDEQTVRAAKAFDRFDSELSTVEQWAAKIAEDDLDVLIFPEFGMDTMAIQLGCLRLAPVQIASWGHPETSGLPTIDYFLSSDLMESEEGESHYSEQLVRLPNLGVCYKLIDVQPETITRQDLGLKTSDIMFWCCQSLYKYLPQHDDIFPRIAKELVKAKFVFIQLESESSTNIFRQRLERAFQAFGLNYQDHCLFLPRLSRSAYAGTTALADIYLDNLEWSGGNTTLESTVYNLPIVTLPGALMRGRHSMAILKMMGVEETIARDKDEYIQIAVRLGNADYRRYIAEQIAEYKHKSYGDLKPVRALENFLLKVCNKSRRADRAEVQTAFQQAEQYYQSQQIEAAEQAYRRVLALQPDHAEALYSLATIEQQKGELDRVEEYLSASVKAQPNFLKSWFSLGNLRQSRGQFQTAERAYRQAIALRPDSVAICNNLGYALQQQDKWSEAAEYYQRALDIMPNCTEAEVNLGNVLFSQAKLTPEQQTYYAELNYKLGLGRDRAGDEATAEIYYRQAILMQPKFANAHYQLGLLLQQQRKLELAEERFQQVVELDREFGEAYYSLGEVYQDLGDLIEATEHFRQALLLINPDYAKAIALAEDTAPISVENCETPDSISGTVTVGTYEYPAIPAVAEGIKRPFWSVVIPVVNRPEFFPECLACVLSQWTGEEDMEIIVLDNGSNPPQSEIPDRLGRGIIRYCRISETIPLQKNWNTAVSLCRGQWIHLLHNDDYVLPGFYGQLKASLETCPDSVGAAFTAHDSITVDRQFIHTQNHGLSNYRGIVPGWIKEIGYVNSTSPPSILIKRSAYEQLGGYRSDILFTCDWELYKRIASFYDWWYEPGVLAHYRRQQNSVTVAENMTGSSGFDHLKAIEISESYLPTELCAEITANSRINHFLWCIDRAKVPLKAGNLEGASNLLLAAVKINSSPRVMAELEQWLKDDLSQPLLEQLAKQPESEDREQNILTRLARQIFYNRVES